ncbi:MAG: multicomponent Na+:H+ antiporter subunit G [Desulfobacteraceae bacterium Eth-SRB1]|nr:MAG: multicomponent Na+:H+ antiporter subunit G [Desulfobacteraceae bacterium Eth-SRB1]
MEVIKILSIVLILIGCFFFTTGTIGLIRFPDFYARMHATGKGDTLAVLICLIGLALYHTFHHGAVLDGIKLVFIAVFMFMANPTATHAISRAAFRCGVKPWTREENK